MTERCPICLQDAPFTMDYDVRVSAFEIGVESSVKVIERLIKKLDERILAKDPDFSQLWKLRAFLQSLATEIRRVLSGQAAAKEDCKAFEHSLELPIDFGIADLEKAKQALKDLGASSEE